MSPVILLHNLQQLIITASSSSIQTLTVIVLCSIFTLTNLYYIPVHTNVATTFFCIILHSCIFIYKQSTTLLLSMFPYYTRFSLQMRYCFSSCPLAIRLQASHCRIFRTTMNCLLLAVSQDFYHSAFPELSPTQTRDSQVCSLHNYLDFFSFLVCLSGAVYYSLHKQHKIIFVHNQSFFSASACHQWILLSGSLLPFYLPHNHEKLRYAHLRNCTTLTLLFFTFTILVSTSSDMPISLAFKANQGRGNIRLNILIHITNEKSLDGSLSSINF